MEQFLSKFSHENQDPQQFLSCTKTSAQARGYNNCIPSSSSNNINNNHIWDANHGGEINLQQSAAGYLLPQPVAASSRNGLAYFNASHPGQWQNDAGVLGCGEDPLSNLSFTELLTMKGTGLVNAGFVSDWNSNHLVNNSTSLNRSPMFFNQMYSSQMNGILDGEMQNCGSLTQYQSVCNVSSTLKNSNANNSNFAPATRWRIDSNVELENIPLNAYSQAPTKHNEFHEQDIAAAMINLQNVVNNVPNTDSSSTDKVSMAVENHGPEKGSDQAIDLNKTSQKKPRRRRYQPKVLSEKKPRKTPKPETPKPMETSRVKRKYVRKTKVDANTTPITPPREANEAGELESTKVNEVGDAKPHEAAAKSCKRSLNFDLNGLATENSFAHMSNGDAYVEAQGKCNTKRNQHNPTDHHTQGVEFIVETSRGGIAAYDLNCALNQELKNYLSLPKDYMDNSQPDPNIISNRKQNISHKTGIVTRSDAPHPTHSPKPSPCASSSGNENIRGSKRSNPDVVDVTAGRMDPTLCTFWPPNHAFWGNANMGEVHKFLLPETCKKKRTEEAQRPHVPSTSFSVPPVDFNQVASSRNHPRVNPYTSKDYSCNPSTFGIDAVTNNNNTNVSMESIESRTDLTNSWADLARLKKKRSQETNVHDVAQLLEIASVLPEKPGPKGPCKKIDVSENAYTEGLAAGSISNPRSKQRSKKQNSEDKQLQLVSYNSRWSDNKPSGYIPALPWARSTSSVEEITECMKQLDISKESCNTRLKERKHKTVLQPYHAHKQEQNALVVYGRDGTMVPFNGPFDPIRKRQRAKVDLDDETIKVWKLLQENIDNKGIDGTDDDKAKWWKNERSVFRGRVDSFIARMRLMQGDRRFSPWKGSVLDSVIGVLLTQNVADHLSSSAFMTLAAHFPLKSEGSKSTLSEESASALVTEPDVFIIEPEESISWNERTIIQQMLSCDSKIIHDIDKSDEKDVVTTKELNKRTQGSVSPKDCCSESSPKNPSSIVSNAYSQTTCILGDDRAKEDATSSQRSIMSPQNSTNSPHLQTVGTMSIFSDSKSRTQPLTTSSQYNYLDCSTSLLGQLRMEESPFLHESFNQTQQEPFERGNYITKGSPEQRGTGTSNYLFNLNYQFPKGFEMLEVDSKYPNTLRKDENSTLTEQSNLLTMQHFPQGKSSDSIPRPFTEKTSSCYVLEGEIMVHHSQSMKDSSDTNASSPNRQTISISKSTNLSPINADVTESTMELKRESYKQKEVEQVSAQKHASSQMPGMKNATNGKSSGRNAGKGKNDTFDWDSLRREAQSNGQKKERTVNTKDSLDWEAVRHADEREIADIIVERGMNKMLAERIKNLLDRLVTEHGSIDMEWLRDIPPDKAKEYLLSFKGLGLKSVECVRLLTLHHLAFPVDINVGRVSVRLGWVPLQPLPESLQLHLLDKYPTLESIQKYMWPRLCKLDQRKLYELHYHLITFGKVFCTKAQPNCNACPLRAECRHFASASASARFALPSTVERSNMPSGASTSAHASSQARSNFLPLPPTLNEYSQNPRCVNSVPTIEASPFPLAFPLPQTNNHLEKQPRTSNFEPIVEVPASPEPEQELEQTSDIEDTLYEDPEEIPTIKLNMKEFSQTRQNCMHTGESNALVALTPEAASIPTPKLKNISRLRTEHHVYELPDTHPLLKGMDKREPDDPSSYLLAIWTPGETAYSIQPPERRCNSKDPSILCNEETCSYCNNLREENSQIVRGTILIPCRTAMRGSFPLNGTYFQVNEVFADHDSSLNPIPVLRSWLWNLPRRTVYFGTSIPTIFKGLTTEDIHRCFWRGFVCLRGFDQKSRAPRPLVARLHFPASKMKKGAKDTAYDE